MNVHVVTIEKAEGIIVGFGRMLSLSKRLSPRAGLSLVAVEVVTSPAFPGVS